MTTKLFKSMNIIRGVSGANLNLFRNAAMVLVLLLGVGNAWASTSNYYSKVTLSKNTAAAGKVYAQKDGTSGTWTENTKTSAADAQYSAPTHTWYIKADPANGYVFKNWTSMSGWSTNPSATANPANGKITGNTSAASAEGKATANFEEITINAGSSTTPVGFENNSVSCTDNTGTVTFPTNGDATTDFAVPTFANTGHGTFSVTTWEINASTGVVTVNYKFVGDNTYGGASGTRSRSTTGVVTLKTCVGNNTNSCTIIASFPNIIVSAGSAEAMTTINTTSKTAEATFPVQWADDEEDFTAAFSDISGGGAWTVNSISYAATDAQSGTITVNYTFDPQAEIGDHSAKLTLSANANAGGASNYVVINAESEALASEDASVTYNNTTTKYGKLADAIFAANSKPGAIVKLLRNIPVDDAHKITSPISVTGAMTLDLNSFTIEKTGLVDGNARVFDINMSNANSVFAIMDSRTGGKIRGVGDNNNNLLTTVYVTKGILSFASGEIECVNTNTGANAKATGIRTLADAKLLMTGGTVTATSSGSLARGVYPKTAPGTENYVVISGGTINVKGATQATGIDCESSSTTVDDPTKASVVLSGVTVNVETTGTTDAIAIRTAAGVSLGIQSGTYSATAKTTTAYALQSSGYTAVLGGTFNATATTTTAHALRCEKGITAVRGGTFTATAEQKTAHGAYICDGAKLLTYGGTFKGVVNAMVVDGWATGTQVYDGGTLEAQGGTFIGEANNLNQSSEIAVCAAGIYLNNASKASYATISNATLQGKINNANLNGAASDTHRGAHGLMTRTTSPVTLTNCTISANTAHKYAFGIRSTNTSVELKNCAVMVNSSKDYNYGIYTYGTAKVEAYNTTITCISQTLRAYGAYIANGSLTAQDCDFTVKTLQTASTAAENSYLRGIYVAAGKSATLNGCTVTAQGNATYSKEGYGLYIEGSVDVDNCAVTVSDINTGAYAIYNNGNTTKIGVASGKFKATATTTGVSTNGTAAAAKQQLYGGYYNTNTNLSKYLPTGYGIETLPSGSTEYSEGYRYAIRPTTAVGDPVCKIGAVGYTTLEEALEYASKNATSSNKLTILMVKDYTLKAGDYILPAYTTLLVPYKSDQTSAIGTTPSRADSYATRSPYRTLTFATGAKMTVYGTIEASAQQNRTDQTSSGEVRGPFGYIILNENASITLEKDAILIAWGFVCGKGTITVKDGAYAYELMSIGWYKGGNTTLKLYNNNSYKVFVITDYAYQNIECPITYHPGAQALGAASTDYFSPNGVVLVGTTNTSFFKMVKEEASADTWVRKEYDPKTDYTTWTMNNGASMSAIKLDSYSSENYYLPITSNFRIILNYGEMTLGGDIEFHAGAELIIKKEATGKIASGKTVVFYDDEDWRTGLGSSGKYYYPATYSPSWKAATGAATNPRLAKYKQTSSSTAPNYLPDAALFVQGKLEVSGSLYTTGDGNTATANRNSNIYSSNDDAGQIIYKTSAPANTSTKTMYKCTAMYGASSGKGIKDMLSGGNSTAYPALLQNGDGTYEATGGTAVNSSWIYKNNQWVMVTTEGCFSVEQVSGVKHYYAYPAGFVEVTSKDADATTHLYTDAETGNRRFLAESDCTWWEVEPEPYDGNKYKCVNPDHNGRYKYYEYVGNAWQEATVTVTWNINGATTDYTVLYGTHPKYLSAAPSKSAIASEYYTWLGWTVGSAEGEFYDKDAELPAVTGNTTFYAYFEAHKYEYTVTFRSHDGAVLEAKRWAHGEIPTYEGTPVKTPTAAKEYTFDGWSSTKGGNKVTVAAASAAADYYAHFAESDRKYTIQWVNYDGTVLKEEQVAYGSTPSEPVTPTRPNDTYYTYTFDAWSPTVESVTGNQTYTATYNYEKRVNKYEVLFKNGTTTIFSQNLVENTVPVFDGNEPTKASTAQYSYTFDGWSTTDGGALAYAKDAALPALTANKTYYAHFASTGNTYTVLWKSEDGKQLLETDPAVEYNTDPSFDGATPTKDRVGKTGYTFDGWSASIGGEKLASLPNVTEDKVFYAHFLVGTYYDITFNANGHGTAPTGYEAIGGSKLNAPEEPTETGYTFGGWYKESACTNAWNFASDEVNSNTTLYAKWTPNTNTAYSVEHYWQNIADNEYTKHETVNMTGTTDAATEAVAKNYTGFEAALQFVQGTVAPDGSTVVKIYYDRKTFTITWFDGNGNAVETDENVKYGATPSYDGATPVSLDESVQYTYPFTGWTPSVVSVTKNATYTATFGPAETKMYPVVWKDWNGDTLYQDTKGWGWDIPKYKGATPSRAKDGNKVYTFSGWSEPVSVVENGDATYTARYALSIDVQASEEVTEISIAEDEEVKITTVEVKGKLNVAADKTLTTDDLILEGTPSSSGEITGEGTVTATRALFDFSQPGGFKAKTWYAVAVPWQVAVPAYEKANNGVYTKKGSGEFVQQELGRSFDLIYYDGARRAGGAVKAWNYVENDAKKQHIMYPGRAYMIYLTADADIIRFERKEGTSLHTTNVETKKYAVSQGVNPDYADWNGIANPATYHAYLNVGATDDYGQVYNADTKRYELFNMSENKLVVGQPIFVQPADETTVVANAESNAYNPSLAPRRAKEHSALTRYELYLAPSLDVATDQIIVRMSEEKEEDEYTVGQDLTKMGVSDIVPQMWINRYDSKMCINTVAPVNNTADYPLGISVPQNGEYDIFLNDEPDSESSLYLTYDGEAIWNLSYSPYIASLNKGTDTHYGLRIVKKTRPIVTGIEDATIQNGDAIRKVIVEDKVFIIRNGEIYSVDGQMVK